jgi:hypothetical protein
MKSEPPADIVGICMFTDGIYNRVSAIVACFRLGLSLIIVRRIGGGGFVLRAASLGRRTILRLPGPVAAAAALQ